MCKNTNIDRSILRHKIGFMQVQPLFCRHAAQTDPIEYNILYVRDAFYKKIPHARAPLRLHGEAVRADGKGVIVFLRIRPVPATGCREHRLRQDERSNPACGHASSKLQGFVEFNREQRAGRHVNRDLCDGIRTRLRRIAVYDLGIVEKLTYRPAGNITCFLLLSVQIGATNRWSPYI